MKLIGIVSLISLFVLTACFSQGEENTDGPIQDTNLSQELSEGQVSGANELSASVYGDYSPELLVADKINILQFHADWCPSCVTLENNLSDSGIPENINLLRVDYDSAIDLRQKYGVTMQHMSVVVDENGIELAKFSGVMSADDYLENLGGLGLVGFAENNNEEVIMQDNTEQSQASFGTYTTYDTSLIGSTEDTVIFFSASWCASCMAADRNLMSSDIPEGLTILKADFDANLELRREYGVVAQHTFVSVDADGNQLRKWVGGTTINDITEKL